MYQVYCDDWLLHDMNMPDLKLISPKLELEVNKAGSLTFTIYPQHPYFTKLQRLKSIIRVYQNGKLIFLGRILNTERGFKNQRKVTCEGELSFLLDSIIRPYSFQGDVPELFEYIIAEHNKQVDTKKQFKVGKITVTDPNGYINRSDTQYLTGYDSLMNKLVNSLGGYLNVRYETDGMYLDYLADFETINSQEIRLCKNILDMTDTVKGEDIATAIIPLGAKIAEDGVAQEDQKRLTIESVNDGKDYVYNAEAVEKYGWIFKTVTFDDVTIASNLLRKGNEELTKAIQLENTIEVKAVDLSGTNQAISAFAVGVYHKVISPLHDLNDLFPVTKMTLNLTAPQNDTLTLGATRKTFTEQNIGSNSNLENIVDRVETIIADYDSNKTVINDQIQTIREEYLSSIQQETDSIRSEVSESVYLKSDVDILVSDIGTQFEQTKIDFEFLFNQFQQDLGDLEAGTNAEFQNFMKYIRFVDGKILLGEVGNELELKLANDRISFFQNGSEVAYLTNNRFYVKDGEFTNSLTLGNFAFIPRANGNLSFKKVR